MITQRQKMDSQKIGSLTEKWLTISCANLRNKLREHRFNISKKNKKNRKIIKC